MALNKANNIVHSLQLAAGHDAGYTLIETLVALVIFAAVALPLGVAVGTLLLNKNSDRREEALLLAETVMNRSSVADSIGIVETRSNDSFRVRKEVHRHGDLEDVQICILSANDTSKVILTLSKTLRSGM